MDSKRTTEVYRFFINRPIIIMTEMERHFKSSRKPLFMFIQTMSAHWPYDFKYEPDVEVPGGGPGTNPEMDEYLRRLAMAKIDFDSLMSDLRRRFPLERFRLRAKMTRGTGFHPTQSHSPARLRINRTRHLVCTTIFSPLRSQWQ